MNDSWGFQQNDKNYKSSMQIIDIFVDVISKGGNLLLNIGPKSDGTIPKEQETILKDLKPDPNNLLSLKIFKAT